MPMKMLPFMVLTSAVFFFVSSLATPLPSNSRIRLREADGLDVPVSVPFRPTPTGTAGSGTLTSDHKSPYTAALLKHEFVSVGPGGPLKREAAPKFALETLPRLDGVAPPEPSATSCKSTNVRALAFSLQSLLKWPSVRRRTTPENQPSATKVTRAAPVNTTVPISEQIQGATAANDIGVKTLAFSGRHSFVKIGG